VQLAGVDEPDQHGALKPEPMHVIELVEMPKGAAAAAPSSLRLEIQCHP
jgi:hypothetical protein